MWSTSNCNHQQHPQHLTFKALLSACLLLGLSSSSTVNNADDNIYAPRPANKEIIFTKVNTANLLRPLQDSSEVTVTGVRALQEEAATEANTILPFSNVSEEVCEEFCPEDTGESSGWISALPAVLQYVLIVFLISFSAFFSGLTLGIMGLDCTGLEIIMEGDSEKDAAAAKAIYPLRKRGNLLLCTFLLGNVAVNALLSILLADKVGGLVGFLGSTALIVIFGEIVPQAVCSRYALLIGSRMVPIVRVIVALVYPIAAPIAYMLDKALGKELATTYSSTELMELLQIHVRELVLDKDTANTMAGALKYRDVTVGQVMTPLENTFMLNAEEKFNFELVATIFKTGYSRIPVYEVTQDNIIGLLFVKDLVFIDPEDGIPVRSLVQVFGRSVNVVWPGDRLGDVLRDLKQGKSHMALVRDIVSNGDKDPYYQIKGIVTLEDIIEEILGEEIVDETDAYIDGSHIVKVERQEEQGLDIAKFQLLNRNEGGAKLSHKEVGAIMAHLQLNYPKAVSILTDNQLERLIAETPISILPTATRELGRELPTDLLYEIGSPNDVCTLVLSGKVTVITGDDKIRTEVSPWTLLGISALQDPEYKADFTAFVSSGPCRCLRFTGQQNAHAVDVSASESLSLLKRSNSNSSDGSHYHGLHDGTTKQTNRREQRASELLAALQIAKQP